MTAAGPFRWTNPVVRGCAPDPSVIRVGDLYCLATSTFDHLPGILLWQSVDLAEWRLVGGAVERPAQYRRDGRPGAVDLFAPTLRHDGRRFWLACTNMADRQGNFLIHAEEFAGPWSDAIWLDREGFDPSLMFDADGQCYYTRRTLDLSVPGGPLGPVVQCLIDPESGEMGELRAITPGPHGYVSNDIEGPHLYRIGGWYYLFAAEGGTWANHMQTVGRSRSPWGPFDGAPHNPVLSHRHRVMHPIQSLGHSDLVEDPRGGWWALALGTRHRGRHHLLGRETFLLPVEWQDDWPVIGAGGIAELAMSSPRSPATTGHPGPAPVTPWSAGWTMRGRLDEGVALEGEDVLLPHGGPLGSGSEGVLFRARTEPEQVFEASVPPPPAGGETGLGVIADSSHYQTLCRTAQGLRFSRQADDLRAEVMLPDTPDGALPVRIVATPRDCRFLVLRQGMWELVGRGSARLLSAESTEWFTAARFALIATGSSSGKARFGGVLSRPLRPDEDQEPTRSGVG